MTWEQRVSSVARKGFTERQAAFLVTVMLHAGVCVRTPILRLRRHWLRAGRVRFFRRPGRARVRVTRTDAAVPRGASFMCTTRPSTGHRRTRQPPPKTDRRARVRSSG